MGFSFAGQVVNELHVSSFEGVGAFMHGQSTQAARENIITGIESKAISMVFIGCFLAESPVPGLA